MPDVWNPKANSIFLEALEQPESAREAFVEQACGIDAALAEQVRSLLAAIQQAGSFLESPPTVVANLADTAHKQESEAPALDFLAPSDHPELLGHLGHYDVQEVIGQGGMGIVVKAFDQQLHRVVAIKVMASHVDMTAAARKQFKREAQAAAAVSHDHVVTIHAVDDAGQRPYFVMQYVAGLSLQQRIDRDGPLQLHEILRIGMQTAAGLAAAHAQGLVHRDIKPANVLLENSIERVKITDFGLANAATDASATSRGLIAGTPNYMSPEQARGDRVDQRTDLFSLGSVLYAMCTGRAPFRAAGTMGVLKRVCEEAPTPIRETNPECPEWLVAIIDKLHAKNPAERFQSAAEVADLLAAHLAELQHPAAVRPTASVPQKPAAEFRTSRRGFPGSIAVAVLLCLVVGLSFSEATGVTTLGTTVMRIFTPHGTLVVETDDPAVKVTIEGDGGLVIRGMGAQEVRLRPGNYKVRAAKDGRPVALDQELVTITGPGSKRVRVRLEPPSPAPLGASANKGAFVILGGRGVAERKFDTLADAVLQAADGDVLEIRGNGPFMTEAILLRQSIVIRAAAGFQPVISLAPEEAKLRTPLLKTSADLVVEGIEFQLLAPPIRKRTDQYEIAPCLIWGEGKNLRVANCRFQVRPSMLQICVYAESAKCHLEVVNCIFLCPDSCAVSAGIKIERRVVKNCVVLGSLAYGIHRWKHEAGEGEIIQLAANTLVVNDYTARFYTNIDDAAGRATVSPDPVVLEARYCIFDAPAALFVGSVADPVNALHAETFFDWLDSNNLYRQGGSIVTGVFLKESDQKTPQTLADWRNYWNNPQAVISEGAIRYEGGDVFSKLYLAPERITPDDFRLRPDSAGYRAAPDGKDLGADVDLVGPGAPYERWKSTPEYQQWLLESGQSTQD